MSNSTTKSKKSYGHLSLEDRFNLSIYLAKGHNLTDIAEKMGRHKSTISRELKRNQPEIRAVHYNPLRSDQRAKTRRKDASQKERLKCPSIRNYVEGKLKLGWSPESIAGRLPKDKPGFKTNYESIYLYIYNEHPELAKELTFGHRLRKSRNPISKKHASRIPNRVSITERPSHVLDRIEFGHWETDTVISRQSLVALQPILERKTRFLLLSKINSKTAPNMDKQLRIRLGRFPPSTLRTITYDNGTENAAHENTNKHLKTKSYFCAPYHSWEKGSVENAIGIVRRYLPKKTDFAKITNKEIKWIENRINNRPRKCLGYLTPREAFFKELACCT